MFDHHARYYSPLWTIYWTRALIHSSISFLLFATILNATSRDYINVIMPQKQFKKDFYNITRLIAH